MRTLFFVVFVLSIGCSGKNQTETEVTTPETRKPIAGKPANPGPVSVPAANNEFTTASGIKILILTQGQGPKPGPRSRVKVHYEGKLVSGKVFDSSYLRKAPAVFPVYAVIKGWQEVLQLMPVGSKWIVTIPPDLAYGSRGAGRLIGPNETLIFTIELLEIK
ncbi:FKBP-type peptidyl-prolyl cis-trans isomerase [Myxococcota bacterium]|nr:FKBP-type peptidyl-prolyl cis-trans isomerase [Myxococcota bacterium]MBU1379234.1 FKBP-type peptidyl-prolyl cis-trans isomerase [Myxococcota bacterium]MBU1497114.1 FKBP-type peptidyl-prolyl cis-trans isomerase [Myxococcota bacterium]